jgi:glycosyltransferase involved in cell wall biosynthesis
MHICALIPAFNEARNIARVVQGTREFIETVVVIDDGSSDGTVELAEAAGAICLRSACNRGKSSALRTGLAYAVEHQFTHVLTLDGDGQHQPQDIPGMIQAAEDKQVDLVIGARPFVRDRMPRARYYANTIGSKLASALVGAEVKDSQSGFRLLRLEKLSTIRLRSRRYEFEMEILIKMRLSGCTIAHSPIQMIYADGPDCSKLRPIRDTTRTCLWSLAYRFLGA